MTINENLMPEYVKNLQPVVLWTNSSSTSSFSSQTLSLSLSDYSYIEVIFYTEVEATVWQYLKSTGKLKVIDGTTITLGDYLSDRNVSQSPQFFGRNITISGDDLVLGSGINYNGTSYSTRDQSGVPVQIIGYK